MSGLLYHRARRDVVVTDAVVVTGVDILVDRCGDCLNERCVHGVTPRATTPRVIAVALLSSDRHDV
jgi:hypothetical protein